MKIHFIKAKDPKNDVVAYAKVPSESNRFVSYFVVKHSDGRIACNCGDYLFRRPKQGCKHCKQVIKATRERNRYAKSNKR